MLGLAAGCGAAGNFAAGLPSKRGYKFAQSIWCLAEHFVTRSCHSVCGVLRGRSRSERSQKPQKPRLGLVRFGVKVFYFSLERILPGQNSRAEHVSTQESCRGPERRAESRD